MNRIYQGRVEKIQRLAPLADDAKPPRSYGSRPEHWMDWAGGADALWAHHELFQDAVNYYTLALAALAEGLSPESTQGAAVLAWRAQVRENWVHGRRKAVRYEGPHKRLAPLLGIDGGVTDEHTAFAAAAGAILRTNGSTADQRGAALIRLLELANQAADLSPFAVEKLPWLCDPDTKKKTDDTAKAVRRGSAQAFASKIASASGQQLAQLAEAFTPSVFVQATKEVSGAEAQACLRQYFNDAVHQVPVLESSRHSFETRVDALAATKCIEVAAKRYQGEFPLAVLFKFWPENADIVAAFRQRTQRLASSKSAPRIASDPLREVRTTADLPVFDYFSNRALYREPGNAARAIWFEFDLAAFIEAIKAPHRFYQDTQKRSNDARQTRLRLHAIDPAGDWVKGISNEAAKQRARSSTANEEDEESGDDFTFSGDPRITALRDLLTNPAKLGSLGDTADGEYTVQERTLRGWTQVRDAWRKRAARGAVTPDELWHDVAEVQGEHRDDFGAAPLYEALTQPENHLIWKDPGPDPERHTDDPLRAWKEYTELRLELNDKERRIRFTPAHPTASPRYFIMPKSGAFGTKHERALETDTNLHFTTGIVARTERGLEPVAVRIAYSAPRLRRDSLRRPGEEDLSSAPWLQPMMRPLGISDPDRQDFDNCRVTLQPSGPTDHQLTFPVAIDSSGLQKIIGGAQWARQFNVHPDGADFYSASLRWPHEKAPSKPPTPWSECRTQFSVLSVDLGQRDAGAFALLDARANDDFGGRPARVIGETGDGARKKTWRAALAASGLLRLSGEDRLEWRKPSRLEQGSGQEGFAWREELFGERGRMATPAETSECAELLEQFGAAESDLLPPQWRSELSFPEQNDKLLVAARRAQSRMGRLHRWAWFLASGSKSQREQQAREEIARLRKLRNGAAEPLEPGLAAFATSGDTPALRGAVETELRRLQSTIPTLLERIANRVLPLRARRWKWVPHPEVDGCWLLVKDDAPGLKPPIRGQRGLSFERIEQVEELRRRFQSLNQSLRRTVGSPALARRDDAIPDPCPDILEKLDRLKEQRVNQTAHLILAQALGVQLRAPSGDKARLRAEQDQHGEYTSFRPPVDFVVIEDLSRYRASQGRAPRENSRLMKWSHRAIRDKLRELCEPFGLPVVETPAAYSSRFCARTGVPGFRAVEVTAGFTRAGQWAWIVGRKADQGQPTEEAARLIDLDRRLSDAQAALQARWRDPARPCPRRTLLVPRAVGTLFVPVCDAIADPEHPKLQPVVTQSDVNAAINLGLRAIADPRVWSIHPRVRTQCGGDGGLIAREKRKYGAKKCPPVVLREKTKDFSEQRLPNLFFDRSATVAWGHAESADPACGEPVRLVLGAAMWKTVRDREWDRCMEINEARLRRWSVSQEGDVPGHPEL